MHWRCLLDWRWWLGLEPRLLQRSRPMAAVTVVIPAYNEEASIAQTIESIRAQQNVFVSEIIVVDDCSTDETGRVAKLHGATVLRTPKNQGQKALAQNWALPNVKTDLIVTMDADTILAPDAISRTIPYFNDVTTASVCGFVIPQKVETVWERGRFIEYVFGITVFKGTQNHFGTILVSSGCFAVFRTTILRQMNGFKTRTITEDTDLTWELSSRGYRIYFAHDAYCYPIDPPTKAIFLQQIDRWYRGLFQNLRLHSFRGNKPLKYMVYWYVIEGLLSPVFAIGFLVAGVVAGKTLLTLGLLAIAPLLEMVIVAVPCLWWALHRKKLRITLTSIPSYFLLRAFNIAILWRSLWREWVVDERLTTWNKGH